MPRLPTNATITHECHDNFLQKSRQHREYTLADGKSEKYNKKEPLLRHFRIIIIVLSWQMTVIRIQKCLNNGSFLLHFSLLRQQGCIPLLTAFFYKVIVAFVDNCGIYGL